MALPWKLPTLSIRTAVLGAIVVGVVLPAVVVLVFDERATRAQQQPLIERNREALLTLAAAAAAEPLWTLSAKDLRQAAAGAMRESSVCGVEVIENRPDTTTLREMRCTPKVRTVVRARPVRYDDKTIGELRIWFDDTEVDRYVSARRATVLMQVLLQVAFGVAVLLGVLSLRLLRPIDRLKASASAIANRTAVPMIDWARRDELGQLGQHLNEVRTRIDELIGELETKNAQLRKMAMYDHLTGLPNRTLFRELFQHEAPVAKRAGQSMALLFIDLDRFKNVNDTLGHAAGDELLLGISQRLLQLLRQSDLVCRVSGDEFLVLLRRADPWEVVAATTDRLLRAIETPLPLTLSTSRPGHAGDTVTQDAQVSASIGVALFPRDGEDFDTLSKHADLAMYQSKQQGRGCVNFYHAELNSQLIGKVEMERELAQAITRGELVLHYQPVIDTRSERIVGCEALVRWQHPARGLLMPGVFIALAEESGLIRELGQWTVDAACAQIKAWRAAGLNSPRVAINVSALQFHDQRLAETLQTAMTRHGVESRLLEVELTESALMSDTESSQRIVSQLRALGIALTVDDFGTGYSSLSYLKRLKPDKLKIDRSFVRDLSMDTDDRTLTQAILRMAQALNISVVAEGVETVDQRDFLRENGCPMLQGYLIGRPMPAEELASRLRAPSLA